MSRRPSRGDGGDQRRSSGGRWRDRCGDVDHHERIERIVERPIDVEGEQLGIEAQILAQSGAHPRLRIQAETYLARHAGSLERVLAAGERLPLTIAGNHCQGTLFRDGRHLLTPALEARIDRVAQAYPGFYIGRFEIRYSDVERFKAGEDVAIVELTGATAESTNIYDPRGR